MTNRDSCLPHDARTHGVPQETFVQVYLLEKDHPQQASSSCGLRPGNTGKNLENGKGVRRAPPSNTKPTPRFAKVSGFFNVLEELILEIVRWKLQDIQSRNGI